MKTKECPFCYKNIDKKATECPCCGTAFKKDCKAEHTCNRHSRGSGDTARKSDGDYEGGYVD